MRKKSYKKVSQKRSRTFFSRFLAWLSFGHFWQTANSVQNAGKNVVSELPAKSRKNTVFENARKTPFFFGGGR